MNALDVLIIVIMAVSLVVGLFRGFIREVLSLASWILALWVAYQYAGPGGLFLKPYIAEPSLGVVAAFVVIFVVVVIAASLLSYLLWRALPTGGISGVDRTLGMLFGAARGGIVIALLLLVAAFADLLPQPWREESLLAQHFAPLVEKLRALMPGLAGYFAKGGPV